MAGIWFDLLPCIGFLVVASINTLGSSHRVGGQDFVSMRFEQLLLSNFSAGYLLCQKVEKFFFILVMMEEFPPIALQLR